MEKIWLFLVGIVVLRSIRRVNTPPKVSMPSERRRHVQQHDVLHVALQHAGLDRRADGDDFIRVHAFMRFAPEELFHYLLHARHARHAANEDDFVNVARRKAGVFQRGLARRDGFLHEVFNQRLKLGAAQLHVQVHRSARTAGDEGQVDFVGLGRRKLFLGFLGFFLQALQGDVVLAQVDAFFLFELVGDVIENANVEIFAAKERVAVRRAHFEHAVADFQHRDVERAAAEVVYSDGSVLTLVEAVSERGSRRFVDDAQHVEAGDAAGVFCRLALRVVEIGRDGDDRLRDRLAEIGPRRFLSSFAERKRRPRTARTPCRGLEPRHRHSGFS